MDPVRNPYAPGAGQRPPELAGRDTELAAFDVALERVERGRPERSLVLTGLRGVGKTVLLNALRSKALDRGWGTGKVEARPDTSLRRPLTGALHAAVRELSVRHRAPDRVREVLATLKAFGLRSNPRGGKLIERWTPAIDGPPSIGRADSGDMEIDLLELLTDVAGLAADVGVGVAVFIDEMQDLTPTDVSALCASCHELSQTGAPLMVVGAGLPHLPSVLSASKSYSERLFRYVRIDRLDSAGVQRALLAPAEREGATWAADALAAMGVTSGGYPYFVQAYGKAAWDHAPGSPITAADVSVAAPEAEAELAVGSSAPGMNGDPSERDYLRAMAGLTTEIAPDAAVSTTDVADVLGRKPSSLSPARDALLKKGLVYSAERGTLAFTVPHFARWLRTHRPPEEKAFAQPSMDRIGHRLRRGDRLLDHTKGHGCPNTKARLAGSCRQHVVGEQQFDHQQVLEQTQGGVGLAYGQRCGRGVVFNAEVQRRDVEGGRSGQLLEFGDQRRGRIPQLEPVRRAGRPSHLPEEGVPEMGQPALAELPNLGNRDPQCIAGDG